MPWINDSIDVWSYKANPCNNLQATLPWYGIMMEDPYFRTNILSQAYIDSSIDAIESTVDEAQIRHYAKWPTWGLSLGTPEQLPYSANMQQEKDILKAMIASRLTCLDLYLPGVCNSPLSVSNVLDANEVKLHPNPASTSLTIQATANIDDVQLFSSLGQRMVLRQSTSNYGQQYILDIAHLTPGIYIVQTRIKGQLIRQKETIQ